MERNPLHLIQQDETRRDQQLSKVLNRDTQLFVPLEVDPGFRQEFDRFGSVHVVVDAEPEVELPRADTRCEFTILVCEGDPELDDPEEVDVAAEGLVVVVA